jgi:diguanylate cyclase (GGDEF)-like protein
MKKIFDSRMLKICFDTAFDSIPDLVWFKDTLGAHLMVNDGFCGAVEKTKEQIYKRGHYYIWDIPKEEYEQGEYVCLESEDVVMQARKTCLFDEKVKTKHGMEQFKTYKSPLIDTDGTIFGTCGIAHNVTDLHNVQRELAVILESMPFGVIITDRTGTIVSTNKKLAELEPRMGDLIGMNYVEWKARSVSDARSYIHGGEEIVRSFEGKKYIIWLREVPIYNVFSEYIGHIALFSDITTEREHAQITMQRANTDFLTGLNNRRSLFDYLNKLTDNPKLTIITIDLDNFKKVNDSFGHHMGDEALVETSRTMCRCFHEDFIARLGGDEFLIAIKRNVDLDKTIADTQKLLDTLKQVYSSKHEYSFITASAGICEHTLANGEKHDIDRLIRNSDKALYKAKNSGKDCICVYENE